MPFNKQTLSHDAEAEGLTDFTVPYHHSLFPIIRSLSLSPFPPPLLASLSPPLCDDRAVYCSCQKQTSHTFRGYVLRRDVTKFQGCALLAV